MSLVTLGFGASAPSNYLATLGFGGPAFSLPSDPMCASIEIGAAVEASVTIDAAIELSVESFAAMTATISTLEC